MIFYTNDAFLPNYGSTAAGDWYTPWPPGRRAVGGGCSTHGGSALAGCVGRLAEADELCSICVFSATCRDHANVLLSVMTRPASYATVATVPVQELIRPDGPPCRAHRSRLARSGTEGVLSGEKQCCSRSQDFWMHPRGDLDW